MERVKILAVFVVCDENRACEGIKGAREEGIKKCRIGRSIIVFSFQYSELTST